MVCEADFLNSHDGEDRRERDEPGPPRNLNPSRLVSPFPNPSHAPTTISAITVITFRNQTISLNFMPIEPLSIATAAAGLVETCARIYTFINNTRNVDIVLRALGDE